MSGTALAIISDGRGYLRESIPSLIEHADPKWFTSCVMVDDSGDIENDHQVQAGLNLQAWLGFAPIWYSTPVRLGGAASIARAWEAVTALGVDYVFHLEEDFTFTARIPLPQMQCVLDDDPQCAQVVLRRDPVGNEGPNGYIDPSYESTGYEVPHLKHRNGFWLNPCLYPVKVTEGGWPEHGHEHDFTARMLEQGRHFAVYGKRDDPPRCLHIGHRRSPAWTW